MPSIRKERWKSVVTFPARGIKNRKWYRRTAVGRDPHQPTCVIPEKDYAVAIPRSAECKSADVAQGSRRTAGDVNFLQFPPGVKPDVSATMRPEEWAACGRQAPRRQTRCIGYRETRRMGGVWAPCPRR